MKVLHSSTKTRRNAAIITATIFAFSLGSFQAAQAETVNARAGTSPLLRAKQITAREEIKDIRASTTKMLRDTRASSTVAIKANREEMQKDIKELHDALKKKIDTRKGEKKQKLDAKKRETVNKALGNIFKKFSEKITRMLNIDARLNVKISQLKAKGIDVNTSVALLATAKTNLQKAQVDMEATRSLALEQAATSTSKEILKSLVSTTETSIISAANSYKKVVESLEEHLRTGTTSSTTSATISASTTTSVKAN